MFAQAYPVLFLPVMMLIVLLANWIQTHKDARERLWQELQRGV